MASSIGDSNQIDYNQDRLQARVRILGTRLGRFVEFEYSLGDGDLSIELILPPKALEEFCREHSAVVLRPDARTAEAVEQIAWRAGHPGLLQRTSRPDAG